MIAKELMGLIHYIDIGVDANTDLTRWVRSNTNVFRLDILAARASSKEKIYLRLEKGNMRTMYIRDSSLTFTIAADESIQFQMLEALLDEIIATFFDTYGTICCDVLGGMANMFEGFSMIMPSIFDKVIREKTVSLRINCKYCNAPHKIIVKKSLIEESENFPVAIVYLHFGNGLLVYIDANFKVRGVEPVRITG